LVFGGNFGCRCGKSPETASCGTRHEERDGLQNMIYLPGTAPISLASSHVVFYPPHLTLLLTYPKPITPAIPSRLAM
jgi:hypothetical protein